MSRNIKVKKAGLAPRPVIKLKVPPSSTQHLSDSEGYSALDDASDSDGEDEEEDVEAAEEQHLIDRALLGARSSSSRPSNDSSGEAEDEDEEDEDTDSDLEDLSSTADDADDEEGENGQEDDNISWNGFLTDEDRTQPPPPKSHQTTMTTRERRVRFAPDVPVPLSDSDMETDTDSLDGFPDIFSHNDYSPTLMRVFRELDSSEGARPFPPPFLEQNPHPNEGYESLRPMSGTEDETSGTTPTINTPGGYMPGPFRQLQYGPHAGGYDDEDSDDSDASTDTEDEADLIREKFSRAANRPPQLDGLPKPETVTKHNGKPRSGKVKIKSSEGRGIVVFDQKKKRLVTLTRRSVQAMDQMVEMGKNPNPFFEIPDVGSSSMPNTGSSLLSYDPQLHMANILIAEANENLGPPILSDRLFPNFPDAGQANSRIFPSVGMLDHSQEASADEAENQLDLRTFLNFEAEASLEDDMTEAEMNGDFSFLPSQEEPTTGADEPGTSPEPTNTNADTLVPEDPCSFADTVPNEPSHEAPTFVDSMFPAHAESEWQDAFNFETNPDETYESRGRGRKRALTDMPPPPRVVGRKRAAQADYEGSHKKQRSISELESIRI